jgi:HK97 family phage major capsid protein
MVTLAGQQDVSIQLLERSFPGVDVVIYDDLQRAYSSKLDSQLLSGTGLNGQHLGVTQVSNIISVAYNDAAPTGKAAMAKVYDAASQIASNRFEQPNVIVMHPRRAAWFANSYSGSSGSPLLQQGSLMLAAGQQDRGFAGSLGGLPVIVDPNIPTNLGATTNADPVILVFIDDLRLAEEGEQAVRYDAVLSSNLMVRLQLFGFSFFHSARQPKSIAVISGTGFGPPVFT